MIILTKFLEENELTDEAEVEKYDSPISMIHDLYDGKVDAIIVGDNYWFIIFRTIRNLKILKMKLNISLNN